MKAFLVYDSTYGNTEVLARAMGSALGAVAVPVADAHQADIEAVDLLIVGSPTQGGRPTNAIAQFLDRIPPGELDTKFVAAFDTRLAPEDCNLALRLLMKFIGFAAPRISRSLERKGGHVVAPPEGFVVVAKEGPLRTGELQRAVDWSTSLVEGGHRVTSNDRELQTAEVAQ